MSVGVRVYFDLLYESSSEYSNMYPSKGGTDNGPPKSENGVLGEVVRLVV